jgi:membrane associated rhomboid family serine protease
MRISYNAPVILTFTITCLLIRLADQLLGGSLIPAYFVLPGSGQFHFQNWLDDVRLVSYVFGHIDWLHLAGNFYIILLIGPILEEKYGSLRLLFMMLLTTLITAFLHIFLFSDGLLGASGIVFMLILLTPFARAKAGTIPLTFILIALLYLSQEFFNILKQDQISQFAHIAGGLLGSLFGFLSLRPKGASSAPSAGAKTADDWLRELGDTTLESKT